MEEADVVFWVVEDHDLRKIRVNREGALRSALGKRVGDGFGHGEKLSVISPQFSVKKTRRENPLP